MNPPKHVTTLVSIEVGLLNDKPRVVIADDDSTIRLMATLAMERIGFEVIQAEDGEQALVAIKEHLPDLVLLDVTMPGIDGFTTCAALRKLPEAERIPVVIITGLDDVDSINRAYEAGATDFVTKPINWTVLGHRVRYILRASRALNDIWESQKRLSDAQRIADMGDWDWDLKRARFRASDQVYRILGKSAATTAAGLQPLLENVHRDDLERVQNAVTKAVEEGVPFELDHRVTTADGQVHFVHHQAEPTRRDESGRVTRLSGTLQDITERKQNEEKIRRLAYVDSLTGLPNRLLFNELVRNALARAERNAGQLAVLFVDLDGFKQVNDRLGHDAGDELLRVVAARIGRSVRTSDPIARPHSQETQASIARLGGDEFVVVLSDLKHPDDVATVTRRMLEFLAVPLELSGEKVVVSCSIGIALYPQDGGTAKSLLMKADAAMYRAKEAGGSTFHYHDPAMNARARERLDLENA
jgi:diguanylate cyclase (GGDEF)-like protein/PAS domain S-box-containing protein